MGLLAVFPEITWLPVVLFVVGVIPQESMVARFPGVSACPG